MVPFNCGELWHLRQIILHMPIRSFEDAKTIDGIRHDTFQHAAIAAGYVHDGEEALMCFKESQHYCTPAQMRSLFVTLTTEGYSTIQIWDDLELQDVLHRDFEARSAGEVMQLLLQDLQQRLNVNGKRLSDYGLPEPANHFSELDLEYLRFPSTSQSALFDRLETECPSNVEQKMIIDNIVDSVRSKHSFDPPSFFFSWCRCGNGKNICGKKNNSQSSING
jgi:hypothetical protein